MILQRQGCWWGSVVSLKPLAVTGLTLDLMFMNFILEFHSGDNLNHHSVNIFQLLNEEMKREGLHSKYWLHIEVEKLKTWLPLSATEQCIRSDYIFWLLKYWMVSCVLNSFSKAGLEDAIIESKSHSNTNCFPAN
jgi:hypothetical protein